MKNIKIIIIIFCSVVLLTIIAYSLAQPRLNLTITPNPDLLSIDGKESSFSEARELLPGEHTILVIKKGHEKIEQKFRIKKYGKTSLTLNLLPKKEILTLLPYFDTNNEFYIEGYLDSYEEPLYVVSLFSNSKKSAEQWFKEKGLNPAKENIKYLYEGEEEENEFVP